MPDLNPEFFRNPGELPADTHRSLTTPSHGLGMRDTLVSLGWKGDPIATVCLSLSTDGSRAANGWFNLWGNLSIDPIEVPATKLWDNTQRGTTILISNIQGQQFTFSSGQLQSEYIDNDAFDMTVTKSGQTVPPSEWATCGIGRLSLRAFAHLDKASNRLRSPVIKVTVLAVPLSAEEMTALSNPAGQACASWKVAQTCSRQPPLLAGAVHCCR